MFCSSDPPQQAAVLQSIAFEQRQAVLYNQLEDARLARQNRGLVYAFVPAVPAVLASDGVTVVTPAVPAVLGTIQTRDATLYRDIANINGEASAALILEGQGVTAAVLDFRDEQNVTHVMTPAQMIAMGLAVSSFINATYLAKWALKEQISNLTPDTIDTFDITKGWPA